MCVGAQPTLAVGALTPTHRNGRDLPRAESSGFVSTVEASHVENGRCVDASGIEQDGQALKRSHKTG